MGVGRLPIGPLFQRIVSPTHRVTRPQGMDVSVDATVGRNIEECQVRIDSTSVKLRLNEVRGEQRFDLRGQQKVPLGGLCPKERFFAHPISSGKQRFLCLIPNGEGKLPIQMLHDLVAELLISPQQNLSIRLTAEYESVLLEFGAQFTVIVNLAINHDPVALVL